MEPRRYPYTETLLLFRRIPSPYLITLLLVAGLKAPVAVLLLGNRTSLISPK